jgi:hypothetical protein
MVPTTYCWPVPLGTGTADAAGGDDGCGDTDGCGDGDGCGGALGAALAGALGAADALGAGDAPAFCCSKPSKIHQPSTVPERMGTHV